MNDGVKYYPGAKGMDFITAAIKKMQDPASNTRVCLFCGGLNLEGLIGVASFEGDAAKLMGAPEGKERAAVYFACTDCANAYPTEEEFASACDSALLRYVTGLQSTPPVEH